MPPSLFPHPPAPASARPQRAEAGPLHGAGLGFRRELIAPLQAGVPAAIDFFELAPENWAGMGGRSARQLREFTERYPFVCHGLSLSLGGNGPLDEALLYRIRDFMREHGMTLYTEHLSWCADDRQLYGVGGIEPLVFGLEGHGSTIELYPHLAGARIRLPSSAPPCERRWPLLGRPCSPQPNLAPPCRFRFFPDAAPATRYIIIRL